MFFKPAHSFPEYLRNGAFSVYTGKITLLT